ncbi:hypothetical protein HYQ45_013402 [Verticillium longisporum]|uniref:Uncharacterized protein n=1 Tax=Verticillium longisporum TaxID=100787 RepID=A0A8I2ZCM3_VERLO|nr:hypothetical protein HYQ45_013402 [Verticillium longisporum]
MSLTLSIAQLAENHQASYSHASLRTLRLEAMITIERSRRAVSQLMDAPVQPQIEAAQQQQIAHDERPQAMATWMSLMLSAPNIPLDRRLPSNEIGQIARKNERAVEIYNKPGLRPKPMEGLEVTATRFSARDIDKRALEELHLDWQTSADNSTVLVTKDQRPLNEFEVDMVAGTSIVIRATANPDWHVMNTPFMSLGLKALANRLIEDWTTFDIKEFSDETDDNNHLHPETHVNEVRGGDDDSIFTSSSDDARKAPTTSTARDILRPLQCLPTQAQYRICPLLQLFHTTLFLIHGIVPERKLSTGDTNPLDLSNNEASEKARPRTQMISPPIKDTNPTTLQTMAQADLDKPAKGGQLTKLNYSKSIRRLTAQIEKANGNPNASDSEESMSTFEPQLPPVIDAPAPDHESLVPCSAAWHDVVSPVRPDIVPIYVRGNELGQTWYAGPERVYVEQFSPDYLRPCGIECCSNGLHGQDRQYLLISTDWVSLEALEYHGLKYKVAWQHYLYLNPVMKYDDVLTLFNFSWHLRQVHVSRQIRGRSAMPVPHMKSSPPPPARFFSQLEFSKPIKRLTGAGDWETPEDQEKGGGIVIQSIN